MQKAIDETNRRRKIQLSYNKEHNITPETIKKEIRKSLAEQIKARQTARQAVRFGTDEYDKVELASQIETEMLEAAQSLDFERAAALRDQLRELKELPELVLVDSKKKKRDFLAAKNPKSTRKVARCQTGSPFPLAPRAYSIQLSARKVSIVSCVRRYCSRASCTILPVGWASLPFSVFVVAHR